MPNTQASGTAPHSSDIQRARTLHGKRDSDGVETAFTLGKSASRATMRANGAVNGKMAPSSATPSDGTIDNPGTYLLDVTRTPTVGNEDNLSPQGPAFTSILILRMLTRRAASLLQKAGSKRNEQDEDEEDAAAIRGQGDEKFGLPLPANFGSTDRGSKRGQTEDGETPGKAMLATCRRWTRTRKTTRLPRRGQWMQLRGCWMQSRVWRRS